MTHSRRTLLFGGALPAVMLIAACGLREEEMKQEPDKTDYRAARERMVERQLAGRDITALEVLKAMRQVPRHAFVPDAVLSEAYKDWPLPIGEGQTISQPYIVAYMSQALKVKKGDRILEIGTGSGYQAAVLAQMGAEVYSIEILEPLGLRADEILKRLGYTVQVRIGDGFEGWPEKAPFDSIIVTAAPKQIPHPLIEQLRDGGRLVIPVGTHDQTLELYTKKAGKLLLQETLPVRFVPMTGKAME